MAYHLTMDCASVLGAGQNLPGQGAVDFDVRGEVGQQVVEAGIPHAEIVQH